MAELLLVAQLLLVAELLLAAQLLLVAVVVGDSVVVGGSVVGGCVAGSAWVPSVIGKVIPASPKGRRIIVPSGKKSHITNTCIIHNKNAVDVCN